MTQVLEPAELYGITRDDIQEIVRKTVRDFIEEMKGLPRIIYFDTSYLYSFDLVDFEYVRRFNLLGRQDNRYVLEWHKNLERWGQDQTVHMFGKPIKPTKLVRAVDRVPNEGLINIAASYTGRDFNVMRWHAVGTGADPDNDAHPSPAATSLVFETSRINVEDSLDGGSLSQEGSTIYVVGNHPISIQTGSYTESGVFDAEHTDHDNMGDYSIFSEEVPHDADQNAIGSTTVIYQCST
jgi:hypothetical protein